jgi:hypothetical protein
MARQPLPEHEYERGLRCRRSIERCEDMVPRRTNSVGRFAACKHCHLCFWCAAIDGCKQAPKASAPSDSTAMTREGTAGEPNGSDADREGQGLSDPKGVNLLAEVSSVSG